MGHDSLGGVYVRFGQCYVIMLDCLNGFYYLIRYNLSCAIDFCGSLDNKKYIYWGTFG